MREYTYNQDGVWKHRAHTRAEIRELAKNGDREAIRHLIDLRGGPKALSAAQQWKVIQNLLGYDVEI